MSVPPLKFNRIPPLRRTVMAVRVVPNAGWAPDGIWLLVRPGASTTMPVAGVWTESKLGIWPDDFPELAALVD